MLATATVFLLSIALAARASAATYAWSGSSSTTAHWSASANWEGGSVPSEPAALEFPRLTRAVCSEAQPTQPCYASENDLSNLTAESMHVDNGDEYGIVGNRLTLGSGGLTDAPAAGSSGPAGDLLDLPIVLGADQTWNVVGKGSLGEKGMILLGEITGNHQLTVEMSERPALYALSNVEVGPLSIGGKNASASANGVVAFEGNLNSADGSPVALNHILFAGSGSIGPLSATGTALAVGTGEYPAGAIEVGSATFDTGSSLAFTVSGPNAAHGQDYSWLDSSGAIELGGAHLSVMVTPPSEGKPCPSLTPGGQYTLVSTPGSLNGSFANAPEGEEIPITFEKNCEQIRQLVKIAYNRSGSTHTVTATVIAGETSSTALAVAPMNPATNQQTTLTATVTTSLGVPSGKVEFKNGAATIPGCGNQAVQYTGTAYTAVCYTSFAAASGPAQVSAAFAPGVGVNLTPSSSGTQEVLAGKSATETTLGASTLDPAVGSSVVYTAAVSPLYFGPLSPSGVVEFLDGETPVSGCDAQSVGAGRATCTVSYAAAGAHSIVARYGGDGNFDGSASAPQSVSVQPSGLPTPILAPNEPSDAWLASSNIDIRNGRATAKIGCEGIDACVGKLTLRIAEPAGKRRGKRAERTVTVGRADYTIAGGQVAGVTLRVDRQAISALKSAHGHLKATLVIAEAKPGSSLTTTVRLIEASSAHKKH